MKISSIITPDHVHENVLTGIYNVVPNYVHIGKQRAYFLSYADFYLGKTKKIKSLAGQRRSFSQ